MDSKDAANIGGNEILITGIIFGIIAGTAVLLRFLTKAKNPKASFGFDDWWILIACILFWTEDAIQIWGK